MRVFLAAAALSCLPGAALAQEAHPAHTIIPPTEVEWKAGPPSLQPGAQSSVLYGDPSKEGVFVMRLKLPAGFRIAPHTHPNPEILTVISGGFHIGMGTGADEANAQRLGPGGFFAFDPGLAHYAHVEEDTVVQLSSTGPWTINYVEPSDDPRQ
jgi:quercetin dioxygenase-like cupin family protein